MHGNLMFPNDEVDARGKTLIENSCHKLWRIEAKVAMNEPEKKIGAKKPNRFQCFCFRLFPRIKIILVFFHHHL